MIYGTICTVFLKKEGELVHNYLAEVVLLLR